MKFRILVVLIILVFDVSCARRGRPEGGPKDFDKPIMVKTIPEFKSLHFKEDEIEIYFDEYIKLKNVSSQLIISPPLKYPAAITPQGTPSKKITIKIRDTLLENTTYTFNFGQSIADNTEGNILENFKYIFSTGDYIDSLEVKGTVKDAFDLEMIENPTLMLYEVVENFNDSIIFNEKPMYVGSTIDSVNWNITNIKAGKYLLIALNDESKNYKFNPKADKIGFINKYITVPKDTSYNITLFNEILPFKIPTKPKEISKGHIVFGYEGDAENFKVNTISKTPSDFKSVSGFDREKDTLHYWYNKYDADSILINVSNIKFHDTVKVKLSSKEIDSLKVASLISGTLHLRDTFKLYTNVPVIDIDTTKFYFINKDSVRVNYNPVLSKNKQEITLDFEKEIQNEYALELFPGAIIDLFGTKNDSLKVKFQTKKTSNYCSLFLTLKNVKSYPIIIDLINDQGKIVAKKFVENDYEYQFNNLIPSRFKVRIIYDLNDNKKWDTGNFLLRQQPEEVYYFKSIINAKANWEVIEILTIQ